MCRSCQGAMVFRVLEFGCNILSIKELIQAIIIDFVLQKMSFLNLPLSFIFYF
jgi:hypothetical protein